jgi:branched-subunit amino acid ABC-type transport system permease component
MTRALAIVLGAVLVGLAVASVTADWHPAGANAASSVALVALFAVLLFRPGGAR